MLKSFNLASICEVQYKSESLERYLKDATVLVPAYGHLFNSTCHLGWSNVNAQARMQAILNEYDV